MLLYVILALIAGVLLYYLVQWLVTAEPKSVKHFLFIVAAILGVVLIGFFSKYGAAIAGGLLVLFTIVRRLAGLITTFLYFRRLKKTFASGTQQNQKTQADANAPMSEKEAREILGVSEAATKKEIKEAYHRLMQKNHPDQGGSEYFAKKLNQAHDVLLKRKR